MQVTLHTTGNADTKYNCGKLLSVVCVIHFIYETHHLVTINTECNIGMQANYRYGKVQSTEDLRRKKGIVLEAQYWKFEKSRSHFNRLQWY